jgi:hypothetical protein
LGWEAGGRCLAPGCLPKVLKGLNRSICTFKRWLSRGDFPENDSVAKDVCFFTVPLASDHFGRHPLVGADFAGHIVVEALSPAEISQLYSSTFIEEQV